MCLRVHVVGTTQIHRSNTGRMDLLTRGRVLENSRTKEFFKYFLWVSKHEGVNEAWTKVVPVGLLTNVHLKSILSILIVDSSSAF